MIHPSEEKTFNAVLENSIKTNWDRDALTDYQGATLQYKDVARKIAKLHILFETTGIKQGDKIAICGRNSSNWGVAFLATVTYGAVAVPILHEFKPDQIHNTVNHSDAKLLFAGDWIWPNLDEKEMPNLEGVIAIADYTILVSRSESFTYACEHLNELFGKKYPSKFRSENVSYLQADPDQLAVINYTSGTTGFSKGVMIPYRALWSNVIFAFQVLGHSVKEGSPVVSMLPMAHMYGMAFEFLFEICAGAHVYFLTRVPSPQILLGAFSEIKPHVIIAVPLIIEKIVKKAVLPKLQTASMKILLNLPIVSQRIRNMVKERMREVFGGAYYEVIIGGAAFNPEIDNFLSEIGFDYTVGYGATECAPIVCYEDWKNFKSGSCGKAAPRMEVRIDSKDPQNEVGEILARGTNVMLGYYKNPEATASTIDADGWYHTGDLGIMDAEGNVFIKGRCKNMLLGSNGQNIYPEEIESRLDNMNLVSESIVIQKGDKLYALIHPDYEAVKALGLNEDDIKEVMGDNIKQLNTVVAAYEKVAGFKIWEDEFEKTAKKSIKRYLYTDAEI
ncbi:MAG: AMP-binding protein [Paludibacteraceae bacterium]|nr:AMP-binding protein [Paludibacteraceae bacterium]MBP5135889.1 AMP-binding protein [Paludibacteraceae bacterium]MBP5743115.1 AMP-binding protein [Paludibacteraceae bacterium]